MFYWYSKVKQWWWGSIRWAHPKLFELVFKYRIYVKYLISGGTAAAVNLFSISFFVEILKVHYLPASVFAFIIAFIASFLLQKFFTFGDTQVHLVHRQLVIYLTIALANLGLNTLLIYSFVEIFAVWYLLAQVLSSILIALLSFFLYRRFVFIRPESSTRARSLS